MPLVGSLGRNVLALPLKYTGDALKLQAFPKAGA